MHYSKKNKQQKNTLQESDIFAGNDAQVGDNFGDNNTVSSVNTTVYHNYGGMFIIGTFSMLALLFLAGYYFLIFEQPKGTDQEGISEETIVEDSETSGLEENNKLISQPLPLKKTNSPKPTRLALIISGSDEELKSISKSYLNEQLTQQNISVGQSFTSDDTHTLTCSISMKKETIGGVADSYMVTFRMNCGLKDLAKQSTVKSYTFQSDEYLLDYEEEIPHSFSDWLSESTSELTSIKRHLKNN